MTRPSRPLAAHIDPDNDWPHCKRCGSYEWDHRDSALGHKMQWPPLTTREIRVADRIMEALR